MCEGAGKESRYPAFRSPSDQGIACKQEVDARNISAENVSHARHFFFVCSFASEKLQVDTSAFHTAH